MERILIIEDDPSMLRGLKDSFEDAGFSVATACTGPAGADLARTFRPHLILLDLMLPLRNGFEVCREIREQDRSVPILILTARDEEPDIVRGLEAGADGYVTKPFGIRELLARAEALLRRGRSRRPLHSRFGGFSLDRDTRRLFGPDGEEIRLSPREFALLDYLTSHPRRALSREELLREVWGGEFEAGPRTVDRFVTVLRGKLSGAAPHGMIDTIREFGYRFTPPDDSGGEPQTSSR